MGARTSFFISKALMSAVFLLSGLPWSGLRAEEAATALPAVLPPIEMNQAAEFSPLAFKLPLTDIARAGQRLVAIGDFGTVLLSDDNGSSWRQAAHVPVTVLLTAVAFVDAQKGWAVGHQGVVLHTEDGGENWTRQLDGLQVAQLSLQEAKAHGDASGHWLKIANEYVQDGADKPFLGLLVSDPEHVLAVGGYGIAAQTSDRGLKWQASFAQFNNPKSLHLYKLAQLGDIRLVVGEQGTILRSRHGGDFVPVATDVKGTFFGVLVTKQNALLVYGLQGTALRSKDLGESWSRSATPIDAAISAGTVLENGDIVLATITGRMIVSHDDGQTFSLLATKSKNSISALTQTADHSIVAVGLKGPERYPLSILDGQK